MDLWIRSQDKEKLCKVCYLSLNNEGNMFWLSNNDGKIYTTLGTYKTKERVLEILDEIENALLNKWANNVKYEETYNAENPRSLVYEMPKE